MLALAIIILTIILDQATKYWAEQYLKSVGDIPIIKNVFHFTYTENQGAAFSILQNQRWLFVTITLVIILVLLYYLYVRRIKNKYIIIAFSLIIGGGIGNLINRIGFNFTNGFSFKNYYVVDFINVRVINFAIFNLADTFVCIGAVLFAIIYFLNGEALKGGYKHEIHSDESSRLFKK